MPTKIKDLKVPGYERVVRGTNKDVGLDVIIAVHNTKLGPALGGCRFWNYTNRVLRIRRFYCTSLNKRGTHSRSSMY